MEPPRALRHRPPSQLTFHLHRNRKKQAASSPVPKSHWEGETRTGIQTIGQYSKLAISGGDYNERNVKKRIQELHKEVLCWRHREGGTHPQCNAMEREWWEKLGNAQAQHNEHVPPPQLRPEFPGLLRRYQDGSLVRAIVSLQEQALAPMAQPMPQHMNGNPNAEEIANRVRILEQEEAEIREVEQGLQVRLLALACRREVALRERAAIAREVEEVARRVEEERRAQAAQAARLVEENRTREEVARRAEGERRAQAAQAAAILVEAERQRNEAARRAEEERLIQAEQMRRYEEIMRQQRERAQRALDEQMRIDQALAQQLEEEERSQEAEIQEAERQNAQRREQGLRRIQNRVARMQRFALHAPPPPQQQLQRNPDIAAPPVQIPIQQALEPHVVRRKALEECFACLEPIRAPEDAEWCRAQCGQNICNGCFELWHVNQPVGVLLRCGLCRVIWEWGGL